jgi:tetratricopeptide (TPR) repeat protein/NAD-dependent SIR2 family protein deacetylase
MVSTPYFMEESVNLGDILDTNKNLVFLVGAGVSMNTPSNLPSARAISKSLLGYMIPSKFLDFVADHEGLRYEEIIEHVMTSFDKELRIMEYFNFCRSSNIIHFLLAYSIMNNSSVITTNFDYLTEWALHDILDETTRSRINLVITKDDFEKIDDAQQEIENGSCLVFKIHGSYQNLATKDSTKESLITTTSALAQDKAEGEILGLESYKRRVIEPLLHNKILVVMGYSGNDDFDISPFLNQVRGIKHLVWIDHDYRDSRVLNVNSLYKAKKFHKLTDKFEWESILRKPDVPKTDKVLVEIKARNEYDIYKIEVNTANLAKSTLFPLLLPDVDVSKIPINYNPEPITEFNQWVAPLFKDAKELNKYYTLLIILKQIGEYRKGIEAAESALKLLEQEPDEKKELTIRITLGVFYDKINDTKHAIETNEHSIKLAENLGEEGSLSTLFNNMGALYHDLSDFTTALTYYEKSLEIDEKLGNLHSLAATKLNMSKIYNGNQDYEKALNYISQALDFFDQDKNLRLKGECLKILSAISMNMRDFDKSLKYAEDSLTIAKSLGDTDLIAQLENKIGMIYVKKRNPRMALLHFKQSIDTYDKLGEDRAIIDPLYNLGSILMISNFYNESAEFLVRAYELAREWDLTEKVANSAFNLAKVAIGLEYWDVALSYAKCAEEDYERIKDQKQLEETKKIMEKIKEKMKTKEGNK